MTAESAVAVAPGSAAPGRRLSVSQWFALTVGALVVIAGLGTVASVLALHRLDDARAQLVDRVDPSGTAALQLSAALVNQETGVRGFALTGRESFLAPYRTGTGDAGVVTRRLERLARVDRAGRLPGDLARVRSAADAWRTDYAEPVIAAIRRGEPPPLGADAGRERFTAVRAALGTLRSDLGAARQLARGRLQDDARSVLLWVIGTGLVLLASVLAATATLRAVAVAPLRRLADSVRGVARGSFGTPVRAGGAREIVALGADVDAMRARIVEEVDALTEAQETLNRQAQDLQRSNEELEQFAYVASHDLQEPLRKVSSFCQLLQQRYGGRLDDRADQYIGFAVDGAKRMQDLINDLLAFSRVGRMSQPHQRVDLDDVVSGARSDLAPLIEGAAAELRVAPLPEVHGDPSLLRLVFQNLLANALKFRGEATPVVRIEAERDGDCWRISCADNGIGIDPQYAERIFIIFQRLHARSAYEGTGIGLAMCRKIVEYHGGHMWLDTDARAGSTFRFTLPVITEESP